MSIELLFGYTGSGKSYVAMTKVVQHLYEGGVVGLNFRLNDNWAYIAALHHPLVVKGTVPYQDCVNSLYKRCYYVGTVETINQLAYMGQELCLGYAKTRKERKTLVVVDEAQLYLNSRNYRENFPWMQLGTQHRKMGLDILLLAHHVSMLDNQVVRLISFVTQVCNAYEQWRFPGTDIRFPWPFIYCRTCPRGAKKASPRMVGFLKEKIYSLYDSYEVFAYDALPTAVEHQGRLWPDTCRVYPRQRRAAAAWPEPDAEGCRLLYDFTCPA